MTQIPNFAPGCFGSALAYQADNTACQNCKFKEACFPLHEANLATLREKLHVPNRYKVRERKPEEVIQQGLDVPKKVRDMAAKLDKADLRVIERLRKGENPFAGFSAYLKIAAHVLLKRSASQELLTKVYLSATKMSPDSANSHARMAIQCLVHIGAVDLVDGVATLRRD
jgi:hypothetical protein